MAKTPNNGHVVSQLHKVGPLKLEPLGHRKVPVALKLQGFN